MNKKLIKINVLAAVLTISFLLGIFGLKAQSNTRQSNPSETTTNWIGYIAFGKEDSMDQINREPFPSTDSQVQIGLRSDGVVVWRGTPRGK